MGGGDGGCRGVANGRILFSAGRWLEKFRFVKLTVPAFLRTVVSADLIYDSCLRAPPQTVSNTPKRHSTTADTFLGVMLSSALGRSDKDLAGLFARALTPTAEGRRLTGRDPLFLAAAQLACEPRFDRAPASTMTLLLWICRHWTSATEMLELTGIIQLVVSALGEVGSRATSHVLSQRLEASRDRGEEHRMTQAKQSVFLFG